jgi:acyl-CoA synthetase (AMP-forming)/AMP-acid ligase II
MTTLREHLRETLKIDPTAGAIEFHGRWRSWGEIDRIIEGIDAALAKLGLPADGAVGCILRNTPEHAGLVLSIVASNRCLVTLNPFYPDGLLAADIRKLRPPVVAAATRDWARPELREAARDIGAAGIELTGDPAQPVRLVEGLDSIGSGEHFEPDPEVAIYMLTSGTTGTPKRVPLTRSRVLKTLEIALRYERNRTLDGPQLRKSVTIHMGALVHVAGLWSLINAVMGGFRICMLDKFDVAEFRRAVSVHKPRAVTLPPSAMLMLLESDATAEEFESVLAFRSGTAPTSPDTVEQVWERFRKPLLTTYGSTEFTGVAGWLIDDWKVNWPTHRGSVGKVADQYEARVVDPETGVSRPLGEEGVLELRGDFVWDGEWVRTTDLAILDADRYLWITGRTDNAINRGGFKVHGEEIGQILERHPDVREACVVGVPDKRLGAVPAAAVVLREGARVTEDELRAWARGAMLPYQTPTVFRFIEEMPRTPSMKPQLVAIRALFNPPQTASATSELNEAP